MGDEVKILGAELLHTLAEAGAEFVGEGDVEFLREFFEDLATARIALLAAQAAGDEAKVRREQRVIRLLIDTINSRASEKLVNAPRVFRDTILPAVTSTLGKLLRLAIGI